MIVVLDVNVIISAVIAPRGASRALFDRCRDGQLQMVISPGMIEEVRVKLLTPRIAHRYHVTPADVAALIELLLTQFGQVDVPDDLFQPVTGDPEDDYVLATCVAGRATHLVTGDKGLIELGYHRGATIVAPRAFLAVVDEAGG